MPELGTRIEYAEARGKTRAAVDQAVFRGKIEVDVDGLIDFDLADEATGWGPSEAAIPTKAESEAKKEFYLAELRKLELEEKSGRLIPADDVRAAVFNQNRQTRDRILQVPDRICDDLAAESDPHVVHDKMLAELRAALEGLADKLQV